MSAAAAAGEATYGGGVEKAPLQQPNPEATLYAHNGAAYSNPPLPAAYQPPAGGNAAAQAAAPALTPGATAGAEPFKRKRGRPRKYATNGILMPLQTPAAAAGAGGAGASSAPDGAAGGGAPALPPGFCPAPATDGEGHPAPLPLPPPVAGAEASNASPVRRMGRPPGSAAKKLKPQRAPRAGGLVDLTPHIFTVQAGEDVASKAMSYSCDGWAVCILSANGVVSTVTLRQGDSSGGTVTYEGRFEILSLAGSYLVSDSSGLSSRTGGLSISLAGPDGRVLGGCVAGPLIAASPIQVVIGSFLSDGKKEPELSFAPGRLVYGAFAPGSGPSSGTPNESSGGHGSPPNPAGPFNNSNQLGFPNFPSWK